VPTHTTPGKPGPLLPTLLERIPHDVLAQFRMEDTGDGAASKGDADAQGSDAKTFDQAAVDRIVADRLTRERAKFAD
jgi:hypothetical protein